MSLFRPRLVAFLLKITILPLSLPPLSGSLFGVISKCTHLPSFIFFYAHLIHSLIHHIYTLQSTTIHALLYHHVLSIVIVLRQVTRLDNLGALVFGLFRFPICAEFIVRFSSTPSRVPLANTLTDGPC